MPSLIKGPEDVLVCLRYLFWCGLGQVGGPGQPVRCTCLLPRHVMDFIVVTLQLLQPSPVDSLRVLHGPQPLERLMVRVNLEFLEPQEVFMFPQDMDYRGQFAFGRGVVLLSCRRLPSARSNEPSLSILNLLQYSP